MHCCIVRTETCGLRPSLACVPRRALRRSLSATLGCTLWLLTACSNADAARPKAPCTTLMQGGRYALCAELISSGSNLIGTQRWSASGSFINVPNGVSNRYTLEKGSFHAQD
jgi:hypothetical protein